MSGVNSCRGLAATCGPKGDVSCCDSRLVAGGTFNRINDDRYPATVSDFRLDTYEVTLGRFKNFLECYPSNRPHAGDGKNPNNRNDPGWDSAWDDKLPADRSALEAALACSSRDSSWGKDELRLPMNCLDWYTAFAFCAWDGGRLPTEAEWNYAAAGGNEQRVYPWSNPPTDETIDDDHALLKPPLLVVGSKSPVGNGRFGQADLAGSFSEWVLDFSYNIIDYPVPCADCANFKPPRDGNRGYRGGSIGEPGTYNYTGQSSKMTPEARINTLGVRCARSP